MKRVCCLFAQSAGWSQWEGETAGLAAGRTTSVVARSQRPLSVRVDAQRERISSGQGTAAAPPGCVADTALSELSTGAGARKKWMRLTIYARCPRTFWLSRRAFWSKHLEYLGSRVHC